MEQVRDQEINGARDDLRAKGIYRKQLVGCVVALAICGAAIAEMVPEGSAVGGAIGGVLLGALMVAVAATTFWGIVIPRWIDRFELEVGGIRLLEYLRLPVCTAIAVVGLLAMAI